MELILKTESSIQDYLKDILEFAQNIKTWLFIGEMGSGKTTTIKNICEKLEVEDEVSSPTYSIVNEYFSNIIGTVYHFDCFRIETDEEALQIGLEDYFYSGYLCLLEWPDKVEQFIPDHYLIFRFEKIDETTRRLIVSKHD